jgi:DNA-directed RNA polymerase specialized sigma24 family protein
VSVARSYLGNRHDAEDLVQELCLEVLEGQLFLPLQRAEALAELLREIRERCGEGGR